MILYGPPGTGKTYNTVNYAVSIIENKRIKDVLIEDHTNVIERYNTYIEEGRITFTTFHQSYGYEEFIEGIKPVMYNGDESENLNITYEVIPGVFKKFL
jgi:5-methylcytosine-specific restriction protein B